MATIKFSPNNDIFFSGAAGDFIGQSLWAERIQSWEMQDRYRMPVQFTDLKFIQFHTTRDIAPDDVEMTIMDCSGVILKTLSYWNMLDGVFQDYNAAGEYIPFYTFTFAIRFIDELPSIEEGTYYLGLTIPNSLDSLSEPMYLRAVHENTKLIRYTSAETNNDTLFSNVFTTFCTRLQIDIVNTGFVSNQTNFIEQDNDIRRLRAYPAKTYTLEFGGIDGLPDYRVDTLNVLWQNDYVIIDDRRFVTDEELEVERYGNKPRYYPSLIVKDYNRNQSYMTMAGDKSQLITIPKSSPALILDLSMINSYNDTVYIRGTYLVDAEADLVDLVDYANDTIKPFWALSGTFSYEQDLNNYYFFYTNGAGGGYETFGAKDRLITTNYIQFVAKTFNVGQIFSFDLMGFIGAIDWGDGVEQYTSLPNIPTVYERISHNNDDAYYTFLHNYPTAAEHTVKIWWSMPQDGSSLSNTGFKKLFTGVVESEGEIRTFAGNKFPLNFVGLEIDRQRIQTLALTPLKESSNFLRRLRISNAGLTNFAPGFWNLTSGLKWEGLNNINLGGNAFDTNAVNNNLTAMNTYLRKPQLGSIDLRTVAGTAPPTGAGLIAKSQLQSSSWSVLTD